MRRHLLTAALSATLLLSPTAALADPGTGSGGGAGGVVDDAFYVDGSLYRTVLTPTDLSGTGAPDTSFDTIYDIDEGPNGATAAPGDPDYHGGRWQVHAVVFGTDTAYQEAVTEVDANGSGDLDTAGEVEAAIAGDHATDDGVVASFVCPVIPARGPHV